VFGISLFLGLAFPNWVVANSTLIETGNLKTSFIILHVCNITFHCSQFSKKSHFFLKKGSLLWVRVHSKDFGLFHSRKLSGLLKERRLFYLNACSRPKKMHGGARQKSSTSKAEKSSYDLYFVGAT
jgi:hypothetical protein